jgi:hypothetical protein
VLPNTKKKTSHHLFQRRIPSTPFPQPPQLYIHPNPSRNFQVIRAEKGKKHHLYEAKINERKKQKEANKPKRLIINPTSPPTSRSTYTYAHAGE